MPVYFAHQSDPTRVGIDFHGIYRVHTIARVILDAANRGKIRNAHHAA